MSHTYPIAPFWRAYMIFLVLLSLGLASVFIRLGARYPGDLAIQGLMIVFAAVVAFIGIGISLVGFRSRLVVSPAGIEFYSIGYQVRAAWDQVEGLDAVPSCSGLSMQTATVTMDRWLSVLMQLRGPLGLITLLTRGYRRMPEPEALWRCIPVRAFVSRWDNSDLARDIAHYLRTDSES
jgi:hypothetical protein